VCSITNVDSLGRLLEVEPNSSLCAQARLLKPLQLELSSDAFSAQIRLKLTHFVAGPNGTQRQVVPSKSTKQEFHNMHLQ
jgi:hypothetical protein